MKTQNKRRQELGIALNDEIYFSFSDVAKSLGLSWYNRIPSSTSSKILSREDSWGMLRRAKNYLYRRVMFPDAVGVLKDLRRSWTKARYSVSTVLDLFPSLKYSYSSLLPLTSVGSRCGGGFDGYFFDHLTINLLSSGHGSFGRVRVGGVSRSHSIRFDPVDSPKELYRYRLRVQSCLNWARHVDVVPVMMTLTLFHRWHSLRGLVSVLKKAWNYFFTGTRAATRRAERMGLCGYIRRMEETLNRGTGHSSGWHPHYHVLLFIPRAKLGVLSDMEDELRKAWFEAVVRYFEVEFGEPIPRTYIDSFREHGLWLSRSSDVSEGNSDFSSFYRTTSTNPPYHLSSTSSESASISPRPPLRIVDDGSYMAKIMGCDPQSVYGGDKEFSSVVQKDSCIPFDLLREDTAENNDLWVEYVLAMKGERNFYFSRNLTRKVDDFYKAHPEKRLSSTNSVPPESSVVARVGFPVYKLFYRAGCLKEFFARAAEGYDVLVEWCKQKYHEFGFPELAVDDRFLPLQPIDFSTSVPRTWQDVLRFLSAEEHQQTFDLLRCWEDSVSQSDFDDTVRSVSSGKGFLSTMFEELKVARISREEECERRRRAYWRGQVENRLHDACESCSADLPEKDFKPSLCDYGGDILQQLDAIYRSREEERERRRRAYWRSWLCQGYDR